MKGLLERALKEKIEILKGNIKRFQAPKAIRERRQLIDWLEELERRRKLDCHYTMMAIGVTIIMALLIMRHIF